jgi:hypothetical protein
MSPVALQFPGELPRAVTVTQVNDVVMALVVLDPELKRDPSRGGEQPAASETNS